MSTKQLVSSKVKSGIFYAWWVLLICCISMLCNGTSYYYGFTAFFNPIIDNFGWTYALVSLAVSLRGLESGIVTPIAGIIVDKFGSRVTMVIGTVVMGVGFLLFSRVNNLITFYIAAVIVSIGSTFCDGISTFAAVAIWFKKRRTLAMGLLTTAFSAGGLLVPALVWLIAQFTWRKVLLIFGIGTLFLIIPVALVVRNPPAEVNSVEKRTGAPKVSQKPDGLTAKETMKTKEFWLLSGTFLFANLAGVAILAHQIPYMVSIGISREAAGLTVIVFTLGNIAGRLGLSWLADIIGNKRCFILALLMKAVGILIFALATNVGQCIPGLILIGLGFGGLVPLRPAIQSELFGIRAFGTVLGLLMAFGAIGSMAAPVFVGWMYDVGKNYRLAWLILAAATLVAVPLILAIRRKASNGLIVQGGGE